MPQGDKGNFDSFLQKVREGTPDEEERTLDLDGDGEQEATERSYRQKLSDALEEGDAYKVWKLLPNEEFRNIPHLKDLKFPNPLPTERKSRIGYIGLSTPNLRASSRTTGRKICRAKKID